MRGRIWSDFFCSASRNQDSCLVVSQGLNVGDDESADDTCATPDLGNSLTNDAGLGGSHR